jgi:pyruvate/2-oxoglutarate dehydrogenase complex dihydrolipoamide acyltransferase (E2) component
MPIEVKLPQLSMGMSSATIGKWLKRAGDQVHTDEPLVEIESEKAAAEVVAPADGTLTSILVAEGGSAQAYEVIAVITPLDRSRPGAGV